MAKIGLRDSGRPADKELAGVLLKVLAIGVAGGAALIGGAAKAGEKIAGMLDNASARLEEQRETYKDAVREISSKEVGEDGELHN